MKRSPIQRRTPLTSKTPIRRTSAKKTTVVKRARPKDTGPTSQQRAAVKARDGDRCMRCGKPTGQIQHRWPRGRGGGNRLSNLILMCGSGTTGCHGWAETQQRAQATEQGWFVKAGEDPAVKPVFTRLGWIVLDDDGGWRQQSAA